RVLGFGLDHRLVEPGRQRVDQVDVAGKLAMLFLGNAAGHEDAEMTDARMDGVDDGLAVGANFVDVLVQMENPSERLLRRRVMVSAVEQNTTMGERMLRRSTAVPSDV